MFPDQVDLALHIANVCGSDDHGILLGHEDDVLTVRSVGTHAVVTAAPHLIAVALQPVAILHLHRLCHFLGGFACGAALDVLRGSVLNPAGGQELLALPLSLLQQELAHLGQIFGLHEEAPSSGVDALRALIPVCANDAQRTEQARVEIVDHLLARHLLHDGRKHIGAQAVVAEEGAWLVFQRRAQEGGSPVAIFGLGLAHQSCRIDIVARRHGQQVLYGHCLQVLVGVGRRLVGEEADHLVGQFQFALCHGEANGCGGEGLTYGVEHVRHFGVAFAQPLLFQHLAVLHDHDAMQVLARFLNRFQVVVEALVEAFRGFATGQSLRQVVVADQLDAALLDLLFHLVAGEQVGHALAIHGHVLVAYVSNGLHLLVVEGGMVDEHVGLSGLQRVEHLQEAGLFLSASLRRSLIAFIAESVFVHC